MKKRSLAFGLLLLAVASSPSLAASGWRQLGPDQRGFGMVTALAFDPARPERAFAGLNGGGIARSGDGGRTWKTMSEGLTEPDVSSIVVHPTLGRLVYAIAAGAAHRSSNDGRAWVRLPLNRVSAIALDPRHPAVVWAGTEAGLFRSRDSGDTWERIQANLPARYNVSSLVIDPQNPRRIYLGIFSVRSPGFWVSENGGLTWTRRSSVVPGKLYADLHASGTVYGLISTGLFRSRDAGRTLQPFFEPPSLGTEVLLAPDPQDASTFFVTTTRFLDDLPVLFRTTDAGRTWRSFTAGLPSPQQQTALAVSSDGHVLLAAQQERTHFAVFRSETSEPRWEPSTRGLINSGIDSFAVGRAGALFVTVETEGVLRSLDGGATWTTSLPFSGFLGPLAAAPSDPDTLYLGTPYPGGPDPHIVWKTTDGGETWNPLPYVPPLDGQSVRLTAMDLAVDPSDPETVFLATSLYGDGLETSAGLFRSRDGGQTWKKVGPPGFYLQVETDPSQPERIFALHALTSIYRSNDHGETWEKVLERSSGTDALSHVAIAPSNPDVVYAVQENGTLFRSEDGGTAFVSLGRRLPGIGLRPVVVDPRDPNSLVFSRIGGVLRLTLGRGRESLPPAFFTDDILGLLFDPDDPSRLLFGTATAGLVEYRFEAVTTPGRP